ncbi:hypothetical protein AGLY_015273 [Aphis glycines]|uniref:Uncharacterized protein n=1 Tax=Aphis glycines TaxID=307491 RepID=A0A6G0T208_APHGL|nr:hypothetical protein AGLY_015273 [Aphis glycines]
MPMAMPTGVTTANVATYAISTALLVSNQASSKPMQNAMMSLCVATAKNRYHMWSTRSSNPMARPSNTSWNDRASTANSPRNDCAPSAFRDSDGRFVALLTSPHRGCSCCCSFVRVAGSRSSEVADELVDDDGSKLGGFGTAAGGLRRLKLIDRCKISCPASSPSAAYTLSSTACTIWSMTNTKKNPTQNIRSPRFSAAGPSGSSLCAACSWPTFSRTSGCRCKNVVKSNTPPPKHNSSDTTGEDSVAEWPGCEWPPCCSGASAFGRHHFLEVSRMGNMPKMNDPRPKTSMAIVLPTVMCSNNAPTVIPSSAIRSRLPFTSTIEILL